MKFVDPCSRSMALFSRITNARNIVTFTGDTLTDLSINMSREPTKFNISSSLLVTGADAHHLWPLGHYKSLSGTTVYRPCYHIASCTGFIIENIDLVLMTNNVVETPCKLKQQQLHLCVLCTMTLLYNCWWTRNLIRPIASNCGEFDDVIQSEAKLQEGRPIILWKRYVGRCMMKCSTVVWYSTYATIGRLTNFNPV